MTRLTVEVDAEAVAVATTELLARLLEQARAARGRAHLVLAGGTTPRRAYELLAARLGGWEDVELWFGDERAVPPDDPDSNYAMVAEALLARVAVPEGNVHRIAAERDAASAAALYAQQLRARMPLSPEGVPIADVALLGLGEDGHTASLFPGSSALESRDLCVAIDGAPKPPPERVTLTLEVLRHARRIVFAATGAGKAGAALAVAGGADEAVPASLLGGPGTDLIVDRAAMPSET